MMKKIAGLLLTSLLLTPAVQAEETVHLVSKGDTLYSLSKQYGVSMETIKQWNQTTSDQLKIGQMLRLSGPASTVLPIKTSDTTPSTPSIPLVGKNSEGSKLSPKRVSADYLNMRESNEMQANVLRTLTEGMVVDAIETDDFWSKIKIEDTIGYVASAFLEPVRPEAKVSRSFTFSETRLENVVSSLLGIPYQFGGASLEGFDCSGFTMYVMDQLGMKLPRTSEEQFLVGTPVEQEDLQIGDLLFFDSYGLGKVTHVSIYIGNNKIAHSASTEVVVDDATWFFDHYPYYGAKRIL